MTSRSKGSVSSSGNEAPDKASSPSKTVRKADLLEGMEKDGKADASPVKRKKVTKTISTRKSGVTKKSKSLYDFYLFLSKHYDSKQVVLPRDRTILEHVVFAVFLENSPFEEARNTFSAMLRSFIDWNEVRVSKAKEIVYAVSESTSAADSSDAWLLTKSERLRRLLQWVFEKSNGFELESSCGSGKEDILDYVLQIPFATRFVKSHIKFSVFDGEEFPLDEGSARALRLLGFLQVEDGREVLTSEWGSFSGDEKQKFFFMLHQLGAELFNDATLKNAVSLLGEFDKDISKREMKPLVSLDSEEPLEVAKILAKQKKVNNTQPGAEQTYDNPSDSDLDEDSDDYGMDSTAEDEADIVAETILGAGETGFRTSRDAADSDSESVSSPTSLSKKRRAAVSKSGEKSASKRPAVVEAAEEQEIPLRTKKTRKSDSKEEGKAPKKRRKLASEESPSDLSGEAKSSLKKSASSTRPSSSSEEGQKGSRVKMDDTNVSSSEPPDLSSTSKKRKIRASHVKEDVASGNLEDQSASTEKPKVSSGVARLKEIQQKKPR